MFHSLNWIVMPQTWLDLISRQLQLRRAWHTVARGNVVDLNDSDISVICFLADVFGASWVLPQRAETTKLLGDAVAILGTALSWEVAPGSTRSASGRAANGRAIVLISFDDELATHGRRWIDDDSVLVLLHATNRPMRTSFLTALGARATERDDVLIVPIAGRSPALWRVGISALTRVEQLPALETLLEQLTPLLNDRWLDPLYLLECLRRNEPAETSRGEMSDPAELRARITALEEELLSLRRTAAWQQEALARALALS